MDEENNKKSNPWYESMHIILTIILIALFIVSLYPQSGIILNTNNLFLLAFIVVLVLSHRFSEIEILPFIKLSQILKSVKEETQELRNSLIQIQSSMISIVQAQATSQSSATVNIDTLGDNAREINERIKTEESPEKTISKIPQRTDIERIGDYLKNGDYVATFSVLRHLLEKELIILLRNNELTVHRMGLNALNETAYRNEIITKDVYSGIDIVRITANKFIHQPITEEYYDMDKIDYIVRLGLKIYNELKLVNEI